MKPEQPLESASQAWFTPQRLNELPPRRLLLRRQFYSHRSSAARRAIYRNRAVVAPGEPPGARQSESGAAQFARAGLVGAVEAVEDPGERLRRDAAAAVYHAQDGLAALPVEVHADRGSVVAVLDGVVQQDGD